MSAGKNRGAEQGPSSFASSSPHWKPRSTRVSGGTSLDKSSYKEMGPLSFENPRPKKRRYTRTLTHNSHTLTDTHASSEPLKSRWFSSLWTPSHPRKPPKKLGKDHICLPRTPHPSPGPGPCPRRDERGGGGGSSCSDRVSQR